MVGEGPRQRSAARARVITAVRRALDEDGFLEVETPVLQPLYGGALARPFTTHHNELGRDLYLRIATELYLKRLIVGGLERVYELGKDFRNEGVSFKHNPEFTMLEWYEAYADVYDAADRLEALVRSVARRRRCTSDPEVSFTEPWRRTTLAQAILEESGVDILADRDAEALAAAIGDKLPTGRADLAPARRRPALEVRRADAPVRRRSSSTTPSSSPRSPRPTASTRG